MRHIVLLAMLLGVVGCANRQDYREKDPWTAELWHESQRIDAERVKTETEKQKAVEGVCDKMLAGTWEAIERIYYWITGDSPFNAAKSLLDPSNPDKRRQAVVYLSKRTWGREPPYTTYYVDMLKTDDEYLVRSITLRTLNRARIKEQIPLYIKMLDDPNELVRLEAAKALANMPDASALDPLIRHLKNEEENIDVRIACADALRNFKESRSAQALIALLRDRNFGLAWQAGWTLKLMTGKDFGYDPTPWLEYLTKTEKPFGN